MTNTVWPSTKKFENIFIFWPTHHKRLATTAVNNFTFSPEFKGMSNARQVNDLHGALRDRYPKQERDLRCKLAALYRLTAQFEWDHLIYSHITVSKGTPYIVSFDL